MRYNVRSSLLFGIGVVHVYKLSQTLFQSKPTHDNSLHRLEILIHVPLICILIYLSTAFHIGQNYNIQI